MRIPEDFKQCVGFFGIRNEDGTFTAHGTGFFVAVAPDHVYLVTAKHVAENFQTGSYIMRFNPQPYTRALSGLERVDMEMKNDSRWYVHPNDYNVDVAVLPLAHLSPLYLAHRTIPENMFFLHEFSSITYTQDEALQAFHQALQNRGQPVSEQVVQQPSISVGDETATVGLYSFVPGRDNNIPVIRIGNVAMMPGEPILGIDSVERELYLIEMRSIAGLSGSPVFAFSPLTNTFHLIGMIHGHHTMKESEMTLHTGMALVTPIKKLQEILYSAELVEQRQLEKEDRQRLENEAEAYKRQHPFES